MKLKELPNEEKPRERLLKYGKENLSNEDLISIIIRTGTKDANVKEVSSQILSKLSSIENLNDLSIRIKNTSFIKILSNTPDSSSVRLSA